MARILFSRSRYIFNPRRSQPSFMRACLLLLNVSLNYNSIMSDVSDYTRESNLDRIIFLRFYHVTLPSSLRVNHLLPLSRTRAGKAYLRQTRGGTTWTWCPFVALTLHGKWRKSHVISIMYTTVRRHWVRLIEMELFMRGREFSFLNQFILIESCTAWGSSVKRIVNGNLKL